MSEMRRYRVGLCGLGRVADFYLHALSRLPDRFELVGAADPDPMTWTRLPAGIPSFLTLDPLLNQNPDVVVIATPTPLHYQTALAAMSAPALLLEKPAVTRLPELLTLYERYSGTLQIALHGAFGPDVQWMAANREKFGTLVSVDVWFYDPYLDGDALLPRARSLGGSWLDSGVNALTCLTAALGPVTVDRLTRDPAGLVAEAAITIANAAGTLRTDWTRGSREKTIALQFENAKVVLEHSERRVRVDGRLVLDARDGQPRLNHHYRGVLDELAGVLDGAPSNQTLAMAVHRALLGRG